MKRLIIMRHGKADDTNYDYKRALTNAGINKVANVAEKLKSQQMYPDLIISSASFRTLQTAQIIQEKLNRQAKIDSRKELYLCSAERLQELLYEVEDNINTLLIIAHNPGVQQFYANIMHEYIDYPPSTTAIFDYQVEHWEDALMARPQSNTLIILN